MQSTDVLIIGAGPTGLVLALGLTRQGVRVRIVDAAAEPGTTSRALAVAARTLELYRQLGLSEAVVERGVKVGAANLWIRGEQVGRLKVGEMGEGLSPFPYVLMFPQDEHERLLIARLEQEGVRVERPARLESFRGDDEHVLTLLRGRDGSLEECSARFLAGCDGARSTVRQALDIGFPGGTYEHLFYVADVEASGPVLNRELHVDLDEADFLGLFPLFKEGHARLIGTVRDDAAARGDALRWEDVSQHALSGMQLKVAKVNWFSTYRVHHRVASRFRDGRVFLLGDAAHIHSPVGGQGMNTGIGDAVNLAWKLAAVIRKGADARLLDTYEPERIPFAKTLVRTTDRAFQFVTNNGPVATTLRTKVAPHLLSVLFDSPRVRRLAFCTVSQIRVSYRASPLSEGSAGKIRAGDRLPWVPDASGNADNFQSLTSVDWQVHVYGEASAALRVQCETSRVALRVYAWQPAADKAGFARDAAYLVRPDGYVAWADPWADAGELVRYLARWSLA